MTRSTNEQRAFVDGKMAFKAKKPLRDSPLTYKTKYQREAWRVGYLYEEAITQGRVSALKQSR